MAQSSKSFFYVSTMSQAAPDAHAGKEEDNGDIPPAFHEDMTLREMKAKAP